MSALYARAIFPMSSAHISVLMPALRRTWLIRCTYGMTQLECIQWRRSGDNFQGHFGAF